MSDSQDAKPAVSPLALDGWVEFNRRRWNVTPLRIAYPAGEAAKPAVEAVLYLTRRGRLVMPRLNAYLPLSFQCSPGAGQAKRLSQWLAVGARLAEDWRRRGLRRPLFLPPDISDARPLQWAGLQVSVRYSFHVDFPLDLNAAVRDTHRRIQRAEQGGYTCSLCDDMAAVHKCLTETETRKGFEHQLARADLELARESAGAEHVRAYLCRRAGGEPASAITVLHNRGARAIGWVGGTRLADLPSGATQLVTRFALEDLEREGAAGFDFAGANEKNVAGYKMKWGGRLVPYLAIEQYDLRGLARWLLRWSRAARMRGGSES